MLKSPDLFKINGHVKLCISDGLALASDEASNVFYTTTKFGLLYNHHNLRGVCQQSGRVSRGRADWIQGYV